MPNIFQNLGRGIAGSIQNDLARIENEKSRQDIIRRRQEAIERLPSLLGPDPLTVQSHRGEQILPLPPEMLDIRAQQRDADLLETAAQINPDLLASSILGEASAGPAPLPADIKTMQALGFPLNEEGYSQFQQMKNSGGTSEQLQNLLTGLQIDKLTTERNEKTKELSDKAASKQVDLQDSLDLAFDLVRKNDALTGTFLEPGSVGLDFRKTGTSLLADAFSAFGQEGRAKELDKNVENLNTFTKNTRIFVNNVARQMADANLAPDSRFELENLISASASEDQDPATNNSIIQRSIELALKEAESGNIRITNRARYEVLLNQLKTGRKLIFDSEVDFNQAFDAGLISDGDAVVVGNKAFTARGE